MLATVISRRHAIPIEALSNGVQRLEVNSNPNSVDVAVEASDAIGRIERGRLNCRLSHRVEPESL